MLFVVRSQHVIMYFVKRGRKTVICYEIMLFVVRSQHMIMYALGSGDVVMQQEGASGEGAGGYCLPIVINYVILCFRILF